MHDAVQNGVMLKFPLRLAGVACWGNPQSPQCPYPFSLQQVRKMAIIFAKKIPQGDDLDRF